MTTSATPAPRLPTAGPFRAGRAFDRGDVEAAAPLVENDRVHRDQTTRHSAGDS